MIRQLYVLDLGNGDMKVGSTKTEGIIVYPSVVGQLQSYSFLDIGGSTNKYDNMTLKRENREYAIGRMALKNSSIRNHDVTEDKYVSPDTFLLSHAAFAMMADVSFSTGNAIIGLPVHKLHAAKDIIQAYQGKQFGGSVGYYGRYDGKHCNVQLEKVIAVAQPHGTLFNLILDDKGQLVNKELARSGVAIFDIGFKTNDGVVFKNLDPIGRLTFHSKNGMHVAYEEIRAKINTTFGIELKLFEIPEIVASGTVKGVNVEHFINEAFYNLASNIILEIRAKWADSYEIENYVFTGGGAELLKPYINQVYEAIFPKNCQQSNAEGMLKYANRLWGSELQ